MDTYDDLTTEISKYLKGRTDLADRIPTFIALAEKRIFRRLRVNEMVKTTSIAAASEITLPADFLEPRQVVVQTTPRRPLDAIDAQTAADWYTSDATGLPCNYRVRGSSMLLYPSPSTNANVDIEYYGKPDALTASNTTNDIFPAYSDVYLYAALLETAPYLIDDKRIPIWMGLLKDAVEQANAETQRRRGRGKIRPHYGAGG